MLDSNRGRATVQTKGYSLLHFLIFSLPTRAGKGLRRLPAGRNAGRGEAFLPQSPEVSPAPLPRGGSVSNNPCAQTERISDFILYGLYSLYGLPA